MYTMLYMIAGATDTFWNYFFCPWIPPGIIFYLPTVKFTKKHKLIITWLPTWYSWSFFGELSHYAHWQSESYNIVQHLLIFMTKRKVTLNKYTYLGCNIVSTLHLENWYDFKAYTWHVQCLLTIRGCVTMNVQLPRSKSLDSVDNPMV